MKLYVYAPSLGISAYRVFNKLLKLEQFEQFYAIMVGEKNFSGKSRRSFSSIKASK